jgi:SAM-dependent methyltransferase
MISTRHVMVRALQADGTGQGKTLPGLRVADGLTQHPFDILHGVRTSGLVAGRHLKSGHKHDRHVTAYYGVAPSVLKRLILRWSLTHPFASMEETTFVDIGAGMGRAMLLASEFRFRAVAGVELHPTLVGIARRNAAIWRASAKARTPIKVFCGDASTFRFSPGPCVVFLFNPFSAVVMRRFLSSVRSQFAARPGQIDLLYVNNEQDAVIERHGGWQRVFNGPVARSRADAIADYKILANQPGGEYASANHEDCSIWRWIGTPLHTSERNKS